MKRADLKELHYITPITNIPSIVRHGILCKNKADKLDPVSIALQGVQDVRDKKAVPGGLPLHDYANLYFCARNPMMFKRAHLHADICVLRIDTVVLDLDRVVIADGNAASKYTAFWPSAAGLTRVNDSWVFADDWTDRDQIVQWRKASAKCAEVLVPTRVPTGNISGAYVSRAASQQTLQGLGFGKTVTIDLHMFFKG